eukprot:11896-Chlamydomonas_euryale.AAC.1
MAARRPRAATPFQQAAQRSHERGKVARVERVLLRHACPSARRLAERAHHAIECRAELGVGVGAAAARCYRGDARLPHCERRECAALHLAWGACRWRALCTRTQGGRVCVYGGDSASVWCLCARRMGGGKVAFVCGGWVAA